MLCLRLVLAVRVEFGLGLSLVLVGFGQFGLDFVVLGWILI